MLYQIAANRAIRWPVHIAPHYFHWPPSHFEKYGVVRVHSEALLDLFLVLDDHRPAGRLQGCQLPTLDTNYQSLVGIKS